MRCDGNSSSFLLPFSRPFGVGVFRAFEMEKKIDELKIHLTETMKRDLQDMAFIEDRKVSDLARHIIEVYLYGAKHRIRCPENEGAKRD